MTVTAESGKRTKANLRGKESTIDKRDRDQLISYQNLSFGFYRNFSRTAKVAEGFGYF